MRNRALCSLIYGNYRSQSDFAREIGWSKQKLSKIVNGAEPTVRELNELADGLSTSATALLCIFLPKESPNRQRPLEELFAETPRQGA